LRSDRKLRRALDRLLGFVENPRSWRRYRYLTLFRAPNRPQAPGAWGWLYELPAAWWGGARYRAARGGLQGARVARAYTFQFGTLLFRPIQPAPSPSTGVAGALSSSP